MNWIRDIVYQARWARRRAGWGNLLRAYRKCPTRKPVRVQAWELLRCTWRYRCLPDHYFFYGLYDRSAEGIDVLSYQSHFDCYRRKFPVVNNHKAGCHLLLNNKIVFHYLMRAAGIPVPEVALLGCAGTWTDLTGTVLDADAAVQRLQGVAVSRLFLKPETGGGGQGIVVFERTSGRGLFRAGNQPLDAALLERFLQKGNLLIEEGLTQHADLDCFYKGSVNTFRIITQYVPGRGAKVLFAALRMGARGAGIDNACVGGVYVGVNPATCRLFPPAFDDSLDTYRRHPSTGVVFADQKFAFLPEIMELCCRAANRLPMLGSIGWDVAYTEKGPVVVEANDTWGLSLVQFPQGGIADILHREWKR